MPKSIPRLRVGLPNKKKRNFKGRRRHSPSPGFHNQIFDGRLKSNSSAKVSDLIELYRHQLLMEGTQLFYSGFVGRMTAAIPSSYLEDNDIQA